MSITLTVKRGTDEWDDVLEVLGDDAPGEMKTEDVVELECDLEFDDPHEPPVTATYERHDMGRFFSDDELMEAAQAEDQEAEDAAADAAYERYREERYFGGDY